MNVVVISCLLCLLKSQLHTKLYHSRTPVVVVKEHYISKSHVQRRIDLFWTWDCSHVESSMWSFLTWNVPKCSKVKIICWLVKRPMFDGMESKLEQWGRSLRCLVGNHVWQKGYVLHVQRRNKLQHFSSFSNFSALKTGCSRETDYMNSLQIIS